MDEINKGEYSLICFDNISKCWFVCRDGTMNPVTKASYFINNYAYMLGYERKSGINCQDFSRGIPETSTSNIKTRSSTRLSTGSTTVHSSMGLPSDLHNIYSRVVEPFTIPSIISLVQSMINNYPISYSVSPYGVLEESLKFVIMVLRYIHFDEFSTSIFFSFKQIFDIFNDLWAISKQDTQTIQSLAINQSTIASNLPIQSSSTTTISNISKTTNSTSHNNTSNNKPTDDDIKAMLLEKAEIDAKLHTRILVYQIAIFLYNHALRLNNQTMIGMLQNYTKVSTVIYLIV